MGRIVGFTEIQRRVLLTSGPLLTGQAEIEGAMLLCETNYEYLDMSIEIKNAPTALRLKSDEVRGEVTFNDVTFTYKRDEPSAINGLIESDHDEDRKEKRVVSPQPVAVSDEIMGRPAVNHASFDIKPGQLAALVRPSGAGKTTITYLVPLLYDVDSGAVEIDGHDVRDIALASLGEFIGVVTQETYLFHASIRGKLLYSRTDSTGEGMIAAARAAARHDRIMELDDGYDTVVGERGYKLSGGEKQRIAIARVILKDQRVLILDEATSALDTHSE